jgi:hypothetical protein
MPRTTCELLDITSNHADGEEAVAMTLNTPQGKGKQVMDHGEGTSSRFKKKKKKNDKRRRDDNFVAAVERRRRVPRATGPSPHRPRTTSRGSWTRRARITRSPSSTHSESVGS